MADEGHVGALHWADMLVIVLYFVMVLGVGLAASYYSSRNTIKGYFMASRSMNWFLVGSSLFASNIGSGHFVGLAGTGAAAGIAVSFFELNALFIMIFLGWLFVPVYIASGVYTLPEYLRKRFGGQRIRVYLACMALLLSIFTKISADLYAGAIFIQQSLKWDIYVAIIALLVIAGFFTIAGGLTAVIWTDTIQTIFMLGGAFALMGISYKEVGGGQAEIYEQFPLALSNYTLQSNSSCGRVPEDFDHLWRSATGDDLPWPGLTIGLTISALWYWCSDQVIVQRTLSSKNLSHAKGGCILAGYLKLLPLYLLIFPGMIARIKWPELIGCSDPDKCEAFCGSRSGCTNIAYPYLVIKLMPEGARGLMLAVMMAALMSSLTSIFNSSATLFTIDIWMRFRKKASEMELLIVGRVSVVILIVVSILWIPIIEEAQGSRLFDYIQSITSFLAPPVCAVFILAVFVKRVNETGAFWGLMIGLVVGLTRFIAEYSVKPPACGEPETRTDTFLAVISRVHFLHFGIILWAICMVSTVVISLLTKPIDDIHLHRLTFWSRHSLKERVDIDGEKSLEEGVKERERQDHLEMQERNGGAAEAAGSPSGRKVPAWRRVVNFFCGIQASSDPGAAEQPSSGQPSDEEKAEAERKAISLYEEPFWNKFVNINAVVMLAVAVFFCVYYG